LVLPKPSKPPKPPKPGSGDANATVRRDATVDTRRVRVSIAARWLEWLRWRCMKSENELVGGKGRKGDSV
jgi:hypothetical protein